MMTISNEQVAEALKEIAETLEEQGENPYRTRAYRRVMHSIRRFKEPIYNLVENQKDLTVIPYVGEKLASVIIKIVKREDLSALTQASSPLPYPEKLRNKKRKLTYYKIYSIIPLVNKLLKKLKTINGVEKIECTGDYRRKKEIVTDFTILISGKNLSNIVKEVHQFHAIKYIVETTSNYTIIQLKIGIQITIQFIEAKKWGSNLLFYTGSNEHYTQLQSIASQKNLNLNQNGLFQNKKNLVSSSEQKIYQTLKLPFIPPELRENRGEFKLKKIPDLVELKDIKGDLHCHTHETDGVYSLEEMVEAAKKKGYQYVAITDHSQSLRITNGMNATRLLKQIALIDQLNQKLTDFKILKSMEVDILADGSLDLPDEILKQLDLTVCSVHSKFKLPLKEQTERILRAMDNPYFNILGHATGRLINYRKAYEIDIEKIFEKAKTNNCFIELNAQPARLDIHDVYCQMAKEYGIKIAISSDAHTIDGFNFMILGVNQARRGWLEKKDIINTYSLNELRAILKK